jgi:hypothetical protein
MLVPVDAWNKMLNQLGNLHEAGQQLAEARERAGKAETEAKFLRERLAQMRQDASSKTQVARQEEAGAVPGTEYSVPGTTTEPKPVPPGEERGDAEERSDDAGGQPSGETTSFWRYVVRGWRGRKR